MKSQDEIQTNLLLALEGLEELYFQNYLWAYARVEIERLVSRLEVLIKDYEDLQKEMREVLEMEARTNEASTTQP